MTVGELKELLDDFGDHLPVAVVFTKGEHEYIVTDIDVMDRSIDNELHIAIQADVP